MHLDVVTFISISAYNQQHLAPISNTSTVTNTHSTHTPDLTPLAVALCCFCLGSCDVMWTLDWGSCDVLWSCGSNREVCCLASRPGGCLPREFWRVCVEGEKRSHSTKYYMFVFWLNLHGSENAVSNSHYVMGGGAQGPYSLVQGYII